jgi:hypothetical protein
MKHEEATSEPKPDLIYRHVDRPEWGLAAFLYSHEDKRAFQFEDGKVRLFKRGYFHHLQLVDAPAAQTARTLARLGQTSGARSSTTTTKADALPIAAQRALFAELYPKGFAGARWRKSKRGFDARRRLKRHRNPSITEAHELLNQRSLATALAEDRSSQLRVALVDLLEKTNLVTARDLSALKESSGVNDRELVVALHGVLYGENETLAIRFERWLTELSKSCGKAPSWPVATAPLALALPGSYVCVQSSTFARQAQWMAPNLAGEKQVTGFNYERWLGMIEGVAADLRSAGLTPADNLDVYDFIAETMTPKKMERARQLFDARGEEASESLSA